VGVLVDELGLRGEVGVHLQDLARHRREQLGYGLDRLDRPELLARGQGPARLGQLEEDDVAELVLRIVGDADPAAVTVDTDPLVILGVAELCGVHVERLLKRV
jgi:hypothetical protein